MGYVLVAAGLIAVVLGLTWNRVLPKEVYWSEEQAREFNEAYDAAHSLTSHPPHGPGESHTHDHSHGSDDLEAARQRLLAAEERLNRAKTMHTYTGRIVSIIGAVLAAAGLALLRRGDSDS